MKNVVLLTIDTLRKDVLGCYGGAPKLTPFMDSIQDRLIRFERPYSTGSYTQSGFPGILTSSYYLDYGYPKEKKFNPNRTLISEPLQRHGITTAAFHSNAYLCGYFGWNRGWKRFYDSMEEEVTDQRPYIEAPLLNSKVAEWLEKQRGTEQRIFMWVHYMDVHEPYVPPRKYVDIIDPEIRLSEDEMFALFKNSLLKRDVSDSATVELLKKLYLAGVRKADDYVKEFFDILRRNDMLEDTVIIITADHGDEFGEHGGLSHDGKMYSELVNVPLLIYDPSLKKGVVSPTPVSTVDIPPTILSLFGLEPVERFQGRSLLPLDSNSGRDIYAEAVDKRGEREKGDEKPVYMLCEGNLKIMYWEGPQKWELYDLQDDPRETRNIIGESDQSARMKQKLQPRVRRWENKI